MTAQSIRARDPRPYLLGGFVAALLTWLAVIYWVGPASGVDITPVANLLSYGIGFLFSAYVGMHIYFFTTAQSQDRQFRQEYTTKHVDEIYAPLYDEIAKTIVELEAYGSPWRLDVWDQKKGTHYAFFVDKGLHAQLDEFEDLLSKDMNDARSKGYDATGRAAAEELRSIYGDRLRDDQYNQLRSHITSDHTFQYDLTARTLSPYSRSQVIGTFGHLDGTLLTDVEVDRIFSKVKERLETLPEVAQFRAVRERALTMAALLKEALKDRVLRPYELRT